MSGYTPPPGNSVNLDFFGASSPPAGDNVVLEFSQTTDRYVYPSAITAGGYGNPVVVNASQSLLPSGIAAGDAGSPEIHNARTYIFTPSIDQSGIGSPIAFLRTRYINTEGLLGQGFGDTRVEFARRFIIPSGSSTGDTGSPEIGNRNRTLSPTGVNSGNTGFPTIGYARWVSPAGFDASRFGTRIIPEIQTVYAEGFSTLWGEAVVANVRSVISPAGFLTVGTEPAQRWGWATVYNLTQYITQEFDINSGLVPPAWPIWTSIENRNRNIGAVGSDMSRAGYPTIENKARPLLPVGIGAETMPDFYKSGMVSYKIRQLPVTGIEPPYISGWSAVYNDAALLRPAGSNAELFGVPTATNTRRTFTGIGGFDSSALGTPMASFRIRNLSAPPESWHSIAPPPIPLPTVDLRTRYIDGAGYDASGYGVPELAIHWNLISPRWTLRHYFGNPSVRNNTPEVSTNGRASDEFGDAHVRLQWRDVLAQGNNTLLFGATEIAYRDKIITMHGINAGAIGPRTEVSRIGTPPPYTQLVSLDANDSHPGFGIVEPYGQVPAPSINQQVVYLTGFDSAKYGSARITANTIRVEPGYQELSVGEPFVSLKIRTIMVQPFPDASVFDPGKPRISPHTIWAVMEAPDQAQQNNPASGALHYVDGLDQYPPGSVFGLPEISLKNRGVSVFWRNEDIQTHFGQAQLFNKRSYIRPDGIRSQRFGWHSIPTTPQVAEQFDSADGALFGSHEIGFPEYTGNLTIYPNGFDAKQISPQLVENFIRYVGAEGFDSSALGTLKNQDGPYMWQGLRVGPLMPTIPSGSDMSQFGVQWISHRVRNLEMTGFDAFVCSYQLEKFDKRMRVTKAPIERVSTTITPTGFTGFYSGVPDIKLAARYIRPDGNSDQFRKGDNHA